MKTKTVKNNLQKNLKSCKLKSFLFFFFLTIFYNTISEAQAKLSSVNVNKFELRWKDSGSGNDKDLNFWHPIDIPDGYFITGSWGGTNNNENPNGKYDVRAFKTDDEYFRKYGEKLVVPATGLILVWTDKGSGADWDGSLWMPTCPSGYYAVGLIANRSHSKPNLSEQKCGCFKTDLLTGGQPSQLPKKAVVHTWNGADSKSLFNPVDWIKGDIDDVLILESFENSRKIYVPSKKFVGGTNSQPYPWNTIRSNTIVSTNTTNDKYHNKVVTLRIKYTGNDNRMLDADGYTLGRNGTKVQTWPFINNNKNQEWKITSVGNGLYNITSESPDAGKYKFLEIDGNCVGQNGCKLQLWEKHNYGQQLWRIIENSDGTVHIQNASPAVKNGSSIDFGGWPQGTNGKQAKAHQYIKTNYNQKWYLHILR